MSLPCEQAWVSVTENDATALHQAPPQAFTLMGKSPPGPLAWSSASCTGGGQQHGPCGRGSLALSDRVHEPLPTSPEAPVAT